MKSEFLEIAEIELDEGFEYYESIQSDLGFRFVNEVKSTVRRIEYFPYAYSEITENTKRSLVKNFPYGIIYQIKNETIIILAVANLHRKPLYWKERINPEL